MNCTLHSEILKVLQNSFVKNCFLLMSYWDTGLFLPHLIHRSLTTSSNLNRCGTPLLFYFQDVTALKLQVHRRKRDGEKKRKKRKIKFKTKTIGEGEETTILVIYLIFRQSLQNHSDNKTGV